MSGRGWCSQVLKALAAYLSTMYWRNMGRFCSVGAQGRTGGEDGGSCLGGQEQCGSAGSDTPSLAHVPAAMVALLLQLPMDGKEAGTRPMSTQASLDKKV